MIAWAGSAGCAWMACANCQHWGRSTQRSMGFCRPLVSCKVLEDHGFHDLLITEAEMKPGRPEMKNMHRGRDREKVRRVNRVAQRKYSAKEKAALAPRSDDIARAVLAIFRNQRHDISKQFPGGREVMLAILDRARTALLDKGYAPDQIRRKLSHVLKPKGLTTYEAEEVARRHFNDQKEPTIRLSAKAIRLERVRAYCAGEIGELGEPDDVD